MKWKDFLYFQSGEKIAILLLLISLILLFVLNVVFSNREQLTLNVSQKDSLDEELARFHEKLETQKQDTTFAYGERNYRTNRNYYEKNNSKTTERRYSSNTYVAFPKSEKFSPGETISMNETDTAQWKKIPGIGSAFAERIVKYGNSLGGFASINQLREVYGLDNELFSKIRPFVEEGGTHQKIYINKLEFKVLLKHPYLNYKQVKAIVDLRRRKGNIVSIDELAMLDEFTESDLERLNPYLSFE